MATQDEYNNLRDQHNKAMQELVKLKVIQMLVPLRDTKIGDLTVGQVQELVFNFINICDENNGVL